MVKVKMAIIALLAVPAVPINFLLLAQFVALINVLDPKVQVIILLVLDYNLLDTIEPQWSKRLAS
jgi:hypothetical protein